MTETIIDLRVTPDFEEDLEKLPEREQARVIEKIETARSLLATDKKAFFSRVHRPTIYRVGAAFESSLYALRSTPRWRVLLTVDEDPVFQQVIVTLLRVVQTASFEREVGKVARQLYGDWGAIKRLNGRGHGKK